jgi:hypothetical protein
VALTSLKGYSVQSAGSNSGTWGAGASTALNEGVINVIDLNMAGLLTNSLTSSNVTLSSSDTQNCMLRFTGTLLANIVVSPDTAVLMYGFYCWENLTTGSYTVTLTTTTGSLVLPQSRRGILYVDSTNAPRMVSIVGSTDADPIPVGTVMVFYQNAAPTGWTISSSLNDYALKIVSSSGGVTSGSVNYSTLFARTATDSHTLTLTEIPSHSHSAAGASSATFSPGGIGGATTATVTTGAAGGGAGHTHDIDMRVKTASVILASRN